MNDEQCNKIVEAIEGLTEAMYAVSTRLDECSAEQSRMAESLDKIRKNGIEVERK